MTKLDCTKFVVLGEGLAAGMANFSLIEADQIDSFPAQMATQMKVAFLQDSGMNESAALLVLSAVLRQGGRETRLFIERDEPDVAAALQKFGAGLFVVAIDVGGHHWGAGIAGRLARSFPNTPLAIVGTWPTLFGGYDVVVITEMPDNVSAAGLAIAFAGGGACKSVNTTPLLSAEEALQAMKKAGESGYKPAKAA